MLLQIHIYIDIWQSKQRETSKGLPLQRAPERRTTRRRGSQGEEEEARPRRLISSTLSLVTDRCGLSLPVPLPRHPSPTSAESLPADRRKESTHRGRQSQGSKFPGGAVGLRLKTRAPRAGAEQEKKKDYIITFFFSLFATQCLHLSLVRRKKETFNNVVSSTIPRQKDEVAPVTEGEETASVHSI